MAIIVFRLYLMFGTSCSEHDRPFPYKFKNQL